MRRLLFASCPIRESADQLLQARFPAPDASQKKFNSRLVAPTEFLRGPSSFLAAGFFLKMRGTSRDSCQVQFASHFAGVLFGSRRKGFPLRLFVRFKRPFVG
jgi:hypothetical protein